MIIKPRRRKKPKIRRYNVKSKCDEFIIRGNIIILEKAHYNSESPYNRMTLNTAEGYIGYSGEQTFRINYKSFKNGEQFKGRVKAIF